MGGEAGRAAARGRAERERLRDAGPSTAAVHAGEYRDPATGAVGTPVFQTTTFAFPHLPAPGGGWREEPAPYLYSRNANPTVEAAEAKVAALERCEDAVAFASGMGAIDAALAAFVGHGDRVVAQRDLYGVTHRLLTREWARSGVRCDLVDPADLDAVAAAVRGAKVLYLESPTNPLLRVVDVPALVEVAHDAGAAVLMDSTFGTPLNQTPRAWGVDVVLHSATKYLNGHGDVVAGFAAGDAALLDRVRARRTVSGATLDPLPAFLLVRGMKTLALRVARANENGQRVAEALAADPRVARVWYPGLASHPTHALAKRLMRGYGGVLAFAVRGGDAAAEALLRRLRLVVPAASLGGAESLASLPSQTSHVSLTAAERLAVGVEPGVVRLALGFEDAADLVADLRAALPVA